MTRMLAAALCAFLFVLTVMIAESARTNLGAAIAVGAIVGIGVSIPVMLLIGIAIKGNTTFNVRVVRKRRPRRTRVAVSPLGQSGVRDIAALADGKEVKTWTH
jgi:hypothetical protein